MQGVWLHHLQFTHSGTCRSVSPGVQDGPSQCSPSSSPAGTPLSTAPGSSAFFSVCSQPCCSSASPSAELFCLSRFVYRNFYQPFFHIFHFVAKLSVSACISGGAYVGATPEAQWGDCQPAASPACGAPALKYTMGSDPCSSQLLQQPGVVATAAVSKRQSWGCVLQLDRSLCPRLRGRTWLLLPPLHRATCWGLRALPP